MRKYLSGNQGQFRKVLFIYLLEKDLDSGAETRSEWGLLLVLKHCV